MSIMRTALPLVLLTGVLTGCAGLQKTDWPTCAAVGGVTGAALGATESSSWAGGGALLVGGLAGAYCWVHGDGDEDGDGVPDSRDKCPGTPKGVPVDANGCPPTPPPAVRPPTPNAATKSPARSCRCPARHPPWRCGTRIPAFTWRWKPRAAPPAPTAAPSTCSRTEGGSGHRLAPPDRRAAAAVAAQRRR